MITDEPGRSPWPPAAPSTVGRTVRAAWSLLVARPGAFLGPASGSAILAAVGVPVVGLILMMVTVAVTVGVAATQAGDRFPAPLLIAVALGLVPPAAVLAVQTKLTAMLVTLAAATLAGRQPGTGELGERTRGLVRRAVPVLAVFTALGVAFLGTVALAADVVFSSIAAMEPPTTDRALGTAALGALALAVAVGTVTAVLGVRWIYHPHVLALEGGTGLTPLRRSAQLTHGAFWHTAGRLAVLALLVLLVLGVLATGYGLLTGTSMHIPLGDVQIPVLTSGYVQPLLWGLSALVAAPFAAAYTTVMYVEQCARTDGAGRADA